MAAVETDSDNMKSARKNLCIVILLQTTENSNPEWSLASPTPAIRVAEAADSSNQNEQKRWQMRPNLRRPRIE
jgi:hypothetical protein